jgi:dihydroxy-acid dehydratase
MTVSGLTLGENLEILEKSGHFANMPRFLANYGGRVEDIIRPIAEPLRPEGAIRILFGNLAPQGAVIKTSALSPEMRRFTGRARVFDEQDLAREAVLTGKIRPGDAVIIRYEGPGATGMPEQFYITEAIASNPLLATTTALITDGRFSGATRGPAIGHVTPEAAHGGPIALIEDNDLVCFDLEAGTLNIIGKVAENLDCEQTPAEVESVLRERQQRLSETNARQRPRYDNGLLGLYCRYALPASEGGGLSILSP